MNRLAVYGWDDEAPRLLRALQTAAPFKVAAIGDRRATALVRARAATGSPCYQHPLEMFRAASYDAAFLTTTRGAAQAAQSAANAGAAIFLAGDQSTGGMIIDAAEAALRARVPFAVLRPRLQQAGLAFLTSLVASDSGWRPRFLDLTIAAPAGAMELARDAIALTNRLMLPARTTVISSAFAGDDLDAIMAAELRYADGRLASIRARTADTDQIALFAQCPLGELELRGEDGASTLTMTFRDGRRETSQLTDRDLFALEARRATRVFNGEAGDALLAPRDGSVLFALEASLETGQVTPVEERSSRANLVLVANHRVPTSTPRGRLHLVGA